MNDFTDEVFAQFALDNTDFIGNCEKFERQARFYFNQKEYIEIILTHLVKSNTSVKGLHISLDVVHNRLYCIIEGNYLCGDDLSNIKHALRDYNWIYSHLEQTMSIRYYFRLVDL